MTPFEDLIKELGVQMDLPLKPDNHESCRLNFFDGISIQIDLDSNADKVLVGAELGRLTPGSYREKIFKEALRDNASAVSPRGVLAYSEKNETLILFQFLPLAILNGEKLFQFLELFRAHAKPWVEALQQGNIPQIAEEPQSRGSGFYGLRP